MKILGFTWNELLILMMLVTTMALFITLPISQTNDSTLGESIFGKNESLEILLKLSSGEELRLKATGAVTMDLVQSLKQILSSTEMMPLVGPSYLFTPLLEG